MAQAQRPGGVIKSEGKRKCFLREATLINTENVLWKRISKIDINHYRIRNRKRPVSNCRV